MKGLFTILISIICIKIGWKLLEVCIGGEHTAIHFIICLITIHWVFDGWNLLKFVVYNHVIKMYTLFEDLIVARKVRSDEQIEDFPLLALVFEI